MPPLIVIGVPRSGTTLLAHLLNRHPDIYVDDHRIVSVVFLQYPLFVRQQYGLAGDVRQFSEADWNRHFLSREPQLEELCREWIGEIDRGLGHVLSKGLESRAKAHGARVWADKSPHAVDAIPALRHVLPQAKLVHIVRDGRAVANSLCRRQDEHLEYAMHQWKRSLLNGRIDGSIAGADRYLEIRFEELVASPETVLKELTDFVGLPFDDAMLLPDDTAAHDSARKGRYVLPFFDRAKTDAWREQLTPSEVRSIERIGGDVLQALGYELAEYDEAGPFRALTPWQVVARRQSKAARRLVQSEREVKQGEALVVMKMPLSGRIRQFVRLTVQNVAHPRVVEQMYKRPGLVE